MARDGLDDSRTEERNIEGETVTIEQALEELDNCGNLGPAVRVVCAEVRRLRAAIEAVNALPRLMQEEDCMRVSECGYYIDRGDVLRILEGE